MCFRPLDAFLVGLFEVLAVPLNASAPCEDVDVVHEAYWVYSDSDILIFVE